MSQRFKAILAEFAGSTEQEPYSIDECFMELTHYQHQYDLSAYAQAMWATIKGVRFNWGLLQTKK